MFFVLGVSLMVELLGSFGAGADWWFSFHVAAVRFFLCLFVILLGLVCLFCWAFVCSGLGFCYFFHFVGSCLLRVVGPFVMGLCL